MRNTKRSVTVQLHETGSKAALDAMTLLEMEFRDAAMFEMDVDAQHESELGDLVTRISLSVWSADTLTGLVTRVMGAINDEADFLKAAQ